MEKPDGLEINQPLSPAAHTSAGPEREKEMPRKWIASYLSGMDEDDFRKRYFKNISRSSAPQLPQAKKTPGYSTSPGKTAREIFKEPRQMQPEVDLGPQNSEDDEDGKYAKEPESPHHDAVVVSRTEDVLRRWTRRTEDDCRMWFIKTLMMKKVISDSPSIKEQKSNFG
jgi:hypothetical protein